jgi:hypothetical protein
MCGQTYVRFVISSILLKQLQWWSVRRCTSIALVQRLWVRPQNEHKLQACVAVADSAPRLTLWCRYPLGALATNPRGRSSSHSPVYNVLGAHMNQYSDQFSPVQIDTGNKPRPSLV